jgi:uncharacterized membrane protein YesL
MAIRRIYDERAELSEQAEKWGTFILANILWAIVSIPLVTLPAATAGLFAVMSKQARGEPVELFHEFFDAMRRLWLKATLLALLDMLVGGLVGFNFLILPQMNISDPLVLAARSVTLFGGLALLLLNLYAWVLLVTLDLSLKALIMSSCQLVFAYPLWSLGVLIAAMMPVLISLLLPQAIFVIATLSSVVLVINWGTWRVIRRHLASVETV